MRDFMQMLRSRWAQGNLLCAGFDTDYEELPTTAREGSKAVAVCKYNRDVLIKTAPYLCAAKPNIAFYPGCHLLAALVESCRDIREAEPDLPIILDGKRGDIARTNLGYLREIEEVGADAITLNPYVGRTALLPFLDRKELGCILLCRTSNPDADEFQDVGICKSYEELRQYLPNDFPFYNPKEKMLHGWREIDTATVEIPFYQYVAMRVAKHWNKNGNCALVVGATVPEQMAAVRYLVGDDMPILAPGIGTQGGNLKHTLRAGLNSRGDGLIINVSSSLIFAYKKQKGEKYKGKSYDLAIMRECEKLDGAVRRYRKLARPLAA
jgi:orotidine-5'-phosphate decarboxylase